MSLTVPPQQAPAKPWHSAVNLAAVLRLHLTYAWRHRRVLSLDAPTTFNELIQWRKRYDRNARLPHLIDKVAVKGFVADRLGEGWVTPTLWAGTKLPNAPRWAYPFVVKSRHGCRQVHFVRDEGHDWAATQRAASRWVRRQYGWWLDEWAYGHVPRGLLVEPFIGDRLELPIDYKFFVFHGRVEAVQVHLEREHAHRWIVLDRKWRLLSDGEAMVPEPEALSEMIDAAEALGSGFDFVRVDLYVVGARPRFGEMTFYPGSGLDPFSGAELDAMFGRWWLAGSS